MSDPESISTQAYQQAMDAMRHFRLPFARKTWRGSQGNWMGMGTGSSIDFQDNRTYQWGDDPRNIHWAAYARTEQLTMKLYRAELSPLVDLVLDASPSMFITPEKECRAESLLIFCLQNAIAAGAPSRIHALAGEQLIPLDTSEVLTGSWKTQLPKHIPSQAAIPRLGHWKSNCMKVLISDLLFSGDPAALVARMTAHSGMSIILAPGTQEEASLPYEGNARITDCESGATRLQLLSPGILKRYRRAYEAHFGIWSETCRRNHVNFARIQAEGTLVTALSSDALREGIIDIS